MGSKQGVGRRQGGWSLGSWRTGISELATFTGLFFFFPVGAHRNDEYGEPEQVRVSLKARRHFWDSKWDFFFVAMLASKFPRRSRDTNTGGCKITHVLSALPGGDVHYMNYLFFFLFFFLITAPQTQTGRVYVLLVCQIWSASALNTDFRRRAAGFPSPCFADDE